MPRTVPLSFRNAAESQYNDEVDLIFLTITHPLLVPSLRVVWDTKDFVYNGDTYIGFPFDLVLLTDDDNSPPKAAQIQFQNVDSGIGEAIRNLGQAPRVEINLLHSSDFDLTVIPRTQIGTPSTIPAGKHLFLSNCKVDVLTITGDLTGYDFTQRVWPGQRASASTLPALFI